MQATQAPQPEAEFQDGIEVEEEVILCAGLLPGAQIAERVGRALALLARTKVRSHARPPSALCPAPRSPCPRAPLSALARRSRCSPLTKSLPREVHDKHCDALMNRTWQSGAHGKPGQRRERSRRRAHHHPRLRPEARCAARHHQPHLIGRRLAAAARLRSVEEGWLSSSPNRVPRMSRPHAQVTLCGV